MCIRFAVVIFVVISTVGCGGNDMVPPISTTPEMNGTVSAQAAMNDEKTTLADALSAADMADGTADKVITKCAVCNLSMDGDPKLSVELSEYTAHLCSHDCKVNFEQNGEEILKALP